MKIALITGSNGLVGSEASRFFAEKGFQVVGIDNDLRQSFFGPDASTRWMRSVLESELDSYIHIDIDIRNESDLGEVFSKYGSDIEIVIHAAAQPSHDWAAKEPLIDFAVNANGTLNLLEMTRIHCPAAVFVFTSTNKVYGDLPNSLPLVELETRWEIDPHHLQFPNGIDESMSIDQSKHSIFGASKVAADVFVQEYGRYFGLKTGVFRGGCLTGPNHSGTQLHGFLAYLIRCLIENREYVIFGHKGKQVRDNIHSYDLVSMFWEFYLDPKAGEVYNVGGGRHSNCSMLEAIQLSEDIVGKKLRWSYSDSERNGDHRWYISNVEKFKGHFPSWNYTYGLSDILEEIADVPARKSKPHDSLK